jgi:hypothetical protein
MAVCDQFSRSDEQPRQRILRQLVEPAPGSQKRFGDDVLNVVPWGPPRDVTGELLYVILVERSEPLLSVGVQLSPPSLDFDS